MMNQIRLKYENAKEFFYQNYDNPKYAQRALTEYRDWADVLYYFENGERIRKVNFIRKEQIATCSHRRECPSHSEKCGSLNHMDGCGKDIKPLLY
jgi:hypothetical protein